MDRDHCYRYETHMHTREGSACASSTGKEMARAHLDAGYTGIFVTDHFFNGNSAIPRELSWREKVELFCRGYESAKAEGERIGLQVFFGFEYGVSGADFLVYNLDKQWLLAHEDLDKWDARQAFREMHQDGGLIIHAHPFRERNYIDHIQLYPRDVDGVETVNGAQCGIDFEMNDRACQYARMFGLPMTAGSDSHHADRLFGSGVESPVRFAEPADYLRLLRAGELRLLQPGT